MPNTVKAKQHNKSNLRKIHAFEKSLRFSLIFFLILLDLFHFIVQTFPMQTYFQFKYFYHFWWCFHQAKVFSFPQRDLFSCQDIFFPQIFFCHYFSGEIKAKNIESSCKDKKGRIKKEVKRVRRETEKEKAENKNIIIKVRKLCFHDHNNFMVICWCLLCWCDCVMLQFMCSFDTVQVWFTFWKLLKDTAII